MITPGDAIFPGNQISQITPNWNKKPLTTSKNVSENLSLRLLYDIVFPSLSGQSEISCFIMTIFHLRDYQWQANFSNHIKFKLRTCNKIQTTLENLSLKLLCGVIFLSFSDRFDIPSYTMSNFKPDEYPWKPYFSSHIKFKLRTSTQIQRT